MIIKIYKKTVLMTDDINLTESKILVLHIYFKIIFFANIQLCMKSVDKIFLKFFPVLRKDDRLIKKIIVKNIYENLCNNKISRRGKLLIFFVYCVYNNGYK